jgi:hypothetical protein
MPDQSHPTSKQDAPDPARSYERAKPSKESGMGRMDNNKATPTSRPDTVDQAVTNKQPPRQINADDVVDARATGEGEKDRSGPVARKQPDHSMKDEEPLGDDQMPTDIHDPRQKRHPRKEGKGGTK